MRKTKSILIIALLVVSAFFIGPFIETTSAAEDFTTYTKVNDGAFTTTSSKITGTTVYLNDACKIYRDCGAVIQDFYCTFTFNRSAKGSNSNMGGFAISPTLSTWAEALASNYYTILVTYDVNSAGTLYRITMTDSSSDLYDQTANINVPFTKYMNFSRSGTTATLKIYNDSGMTALFDTLTITCNTVPWRYIYGHLSYGYSSAGTAQTGYIENLVTHYTPLSESPIKTDIGTGYSYQPGHSIARTSDGRSHLVYRDGTNVQYKYSDDDGATWSSSTQILAGNYYPAIACDSKDNLHVAIATYTNQKIYYLQRWASNGTWSTALDRGYGAANQYGICIVVDAADNLHLAWYRSGDYSLYRFYNAATSTWGSVTQMSTSTGACPALCVAPNGYVYNGWYTGNYFNFKYWDGSVWSAVKSYTFGAVPHGEMHLAVDNGNRLHLVERIQSSVASLQIAYACSDDYGTTWTNVNSAMSARTGYQYSPTLSIDAEGTLHLIWQGYTVGGSYYASQYRKSTNRGSSWFTQKALVSYSSHQDSYSQLYAMYPIINGKRMNQMTTGYAFTYSNATSTKLNYYANGVFPDETITWYDYNWKYSKKITIDHTKVSVDNLTLRPNAAGTSTGYTPVGAVNNWDCVDDATPDNDTTYVKGLGAAFGTPDRYAIPDHGTLTGRINYLKIVGVAKYTGTNGDTRFGFRNSLGDTYYNNIIALTSSYTEYSITWTTNPATGLPFTWSEIDSMELALYLRSADGTDARCTQLYAIVNYDLVNFPVLVSTTDIDLTKAQADGDDFVFLASDNKTKYNHEIEKWDGGTGEFASWVNVTLLSSTVDTILYLYYGNPSCSSQQNKVGTWDSNYKAVWHMKDATTSTISDSTSNGKTGTKAAANEPLESTGKISYAQDFDGSNDYITAGASSGFISGANGVMTVEAWAKPDVISSGDGTQRIITFNGDAAGTKYTLSFGSSDNIQTYVGTEPPNWLTFTSTVSTGTFYYLTDVCDGSNWYHYLNGASNGTAAWGHSAFGTYNCLIGDLAGTGTTRYMNGIIDELRISKSQRSEGYVKTSYNTMNSPGTFLSFGDEQTSWYDTGWVYRQKISIDHNKIDYSQINFPVLVKTTMNASHVQSDGDDILFTSFNGVKFNHEIESYNSTSGALVSWVNVTYINSLTPDVYFFMYYGHSNCSNQQNVQGTWDRNHKLTLHMKDASSTTIADSTSGNYTGTKRTTGEPIEITGKIAKAQDFDGNNDFTKHGDILDSVWTGSSAKFTLSAWIKLDVVGATQIIIGKNGDTSQGENNRQYYFIISDTNRLAAVMQYSLTSGNSRSYVGNGITFSAGIWYYVTAIYDGSLAEASRMKFYVNGSAETYTASGSGTGSIQDGTAQLSIGAVVGTAATTPSSMLNGIIDEVRASNTLRASPWISAEYRNMNDPANFTSYSSEEGYEGAGGEENTAPNTPTSLGPTTRQTSTTVNIYATGSDPDGGSLYLYFYNDADDVEIGHTSISNDTQGQVSWSTLTRGSTYTFYARAYDGSLWSSNSSTCQFTINSLPVCTGFMTENLTDPSRIATLIPYFNWTYTDGDSDTQVQYEIDIGTTNNSNDVWNPDAVTSANHYAIYAGSTLSRSQLYYVRVRVYDGYEWSSW